MVTRLFNVRLRGVADSDTDPLELHRQRVQLVIVGHGHNLCDSSLAPGHGDSIPCTVYNIPSHPSTTHSALPTPRSKQPSSDLKHTSLHSDKLSKHLVEVNSSAVADHFSGFRRDLTEVMKAFIAIVALLNSVQGAKYAPGAVCNTNLECSEHCINNEWTVKVSLSDGGWALACARTTDSTQLYRQMSEAR